MPPSLMSQLAGRIQLFGPGSAVVKLPVIGHTDPCADGDRCQPFRIPSPRPNRWFGDANYRRHQHTALVAAGQAITPGRQTIERPDRLARSRFLASLSANDRQSRMNALRGAGKDWHLQQSR